MGYSIKVRENRMRRAARRQGLVLVKSQRRDPRAIGYGLYALLDGDTGFPIHGDDGAEQTWHVLDLDDVERWLVK